MKRLDVDEYFMRIALLASERGTCLRRKVGCVLVNNLNHIIATGYNGVPRSVKHCYDSPCESAFARSGEGLDKCMAVHAEQNALLQCHDVNSISTCYVTASPCITCTKLLMNTSCVRIVFLDEYPHGDARALWEDKGGRFWQKLTMRPS